MCQIPLTCSVIHSRKTLRDLLGHGPRAIGKTNTSVRAVLEAILASRLPGACKTHVDLISSEELGVIPFNLAEAGVFIENQVSCRH